MRRRWGCPDLGAKKGPGQENPVPGSRHEFPECPAYFLRTRDLDMPAEHLVGGVHHPAELIRDRASELEVGAISADQLSPKERELAHLWLRERADRNTYEAERRKERHGANR